MEAHFVEELVVAVEVLDVDLCKACPRLLQTPRALHGEEHVSGQCAGRYDIQGDVFPRRSSTTAIRAKVVLRVGAIA